LLSASAVDALFAPLAGFNKFLVAVSGGPDSTALLLTASDWAKRRSDASLVVATVDHGLRPESAAECSAVAALSERLGLHCHVLRWEGEKPATRLQERAREARLHLLLSCARRVGADVLLLAHHADDQAETVLFRLARGSGLSGLGAMAAKTMIDGLCVARPLLGVPKSALVAHCEAQGVAFVRDPSNADPRFARARLKPLIAALAKEGLGAAALGRFARRARRADEALERKTDEAEARLVGAGIVDGRALIGEPEEIALRLLIRQALRVSGRARQAISLAAMERLEARLREALTEGEPFAANVAGAEFRARPDGRLTIAGERPRRTRRTRARVGDDASPARPA